jgi:hypothetical protein
MPPPKTLWLAPLHMAGASLAGFEICVVTIALGLFNTLLLDIIN